MENYIHIFGEKDTKQTIFLHFYFLCVYNRELESGKMSQNSKYY